MSDFKSIIGKAAAGTALSREEARAAFDIDSGRFIPGDQSVEIGIHREIHAAGKQKNGKPRQARK